MKILYLYCQIIINATTFLFYNFNRFTFFIFRALSIQAKVIPPVANVSLVSKEESRDFMAVFPDLVRDLTDAGRHTDIPEVTKTFVKILQYNVPNGKKSRGLAVVAAYKMLEEAEKLTPENMRLANVLGWCVEMVSCLIDEE